MSHQTTPHEDSDSDVATADDTRFAEAGALSLRAPSEDPVVDPNTIVVDGRIVAGTLLYVPARAIVKLAQC